MSAKLCAQVTPLWTDMPNGIGKACLIGFAFGVGLVLLAVLGIVLLATLAAAPLLLYLSYVFNSVGSLLVFLALMLLALAIGGVLIGFALRWIGRAYRAHIHDGWGRWATGIGAVATVALAITFAPVDLKDMWWSITGAPSSTQRAALPASAAAVRRMHDVVTPAATAGNPGAQFELGLALLRGTDGEKPDRVAGARWIRQSAAQAQGSEARLLLAVERQAEPIPQGGRLRTSADVDAKADALRSTPEGQSGPWRPVALATIGLLQGKSYDGTRIEDEPMRATLAAAGSAGSRAFAIYAAGLYEATARSRAEEGNAAAAAQAWQHALDGYAAAGDVFEIQRLQHELASTPLVPATLPSPAANLPAIHPALSTRMLSFATLLKGDSVSANRIASGDVELAAAAALMAVELSPDPTQAASPGLLSTWSRAGPPFGRWLLTLRHARGDCMAALELSELTRSWSGPPVMDTAGNPTTPRADAWALIWAERAGRCAQTAADKDAVARRVHNLNALIPYARLPAGVLDRARSDVEATLAALR